MTNPSSGGISISVVGDVSGQVVGGHGNVVSATNIGAAGVLSAGEQNALREALASLTKQVAAEAPPEVRGEALERVKELQGAITAERPDVSRMDAVWKWFRANVPRLAGAVVSVVVNPIVGKLVEAAGEAVSGEFRRRFGKTGVPTGE